MRGSLTVHLSDNLISMKEIGATEAARHFSDVLDAVENRRDSFLVTRGGKLVARIGPVAETTGAAVKALLRSPDVDPAWADELAALRSSLVPEERAWPD